VSEDKTILVDEETSDTTVGEREKTPQVKIEEEEEEDEDGTVIAGDADVTRDSLVEELLSDEDVEMSGL
jgi:hypothetical protein